jgi:hypothetical protein
MTAWCTRNTVGAMSVEVPRSLRWAVREHRDGWRLYLAGHSALGVPGPVIWVPMLLSAVAVFAVGLGLGLMLLLLPDPSGHLDAAIVLTVFLTGPLGLWVIYGALRLAVAAVRSAIAFGRVDLRPTGRPTHIVLSSSIRRLVIDVADLIGVTVRRSQSGLEIVLRTHDKAVVCPANSLAAVDPDVLTAWLSEILAPAEVPVQHCDTRPNASGSQ